MPRQHTEKAFESAIEEFLVSNGGFQKGDKSAFDPERGFFPQEVLAFIRATQSKEWEYLRNLQKEKAEEILLDDLCRALNVNSRPMGAMHVRLKGGHFSGFGTAGVIAEKSGPWQAV